MLYGVKPTDIGILTHKFSPISEKNGFKQSGHVASLKYGTLFTTSDDSDQNLGSWFSRMIVPIIGNKTKSAPAPAPISIPAPQPNPVIAPTPAVTINPPKPIAGNSGPIFTTQPVGNATPPSFKYDGGTALVASDRVRTNLGDDMTLAGFSFKSVTKAVSQAASQVANVAKKAVPLAVTVATKAATGGITLVTQTGILGADAKKLGQRADVVAAGTIGGAVAGAITGGVPGVFAGAVAGGTKGLVDATATSKPGNVDTVRTLYQGAGYGAAAGGVARVVNAGVSSYQQAQLVKSAAQAEEAGYGAAADTAHAASDVAASGSGYGAAADTAHAASAEVASAAGEGAASTTAAATKTAASGLLGSSIKNVAEIAGLKLLLGGGTGGNPLLIPGGEGAGSAQPIYIPGSGSDGSAYSYPMGTTNTSLPANDGGLTPLPQNPLTPVSNILGMPPVAIYGALAVGAAFLLLKRRKAA